MNDAHDGARNGAVRELGNRKIVHVDMAGSDSHDVELRSRTKWILLLGFVALRGSLVTNSEAAAVTVRLADCTSSELHRFMSRSLILVEAILRT